uniref:Solute carrier family 40 member n=1 Tax=Strigamia maritima TaxID=126957 RepID=T1JCZ3_STRMM
MWSFSVGLYLVMLDKSSLRLTAIYGLTSCISLIIFGAPIGRWIDRTNRLHAARTALLLQNTFVAICASVLVLSSYYEDRIKKMEAIYEELTHWAVICLAVLADLASAASRIIIGKDWIVVISKNSHHLAYMNAMARRIDLTSLICAPIITGQLMTYTSMVITAIFIAVWNLVSMFVEFFLISKLYYSTPALATKKSFKKRVASFASSLSRNAVVQAQIRAEDDNSSNLFASFFNGWKLYFQQNVVFAGLGLACLYMTVLGFDSITQGYANQQGVSAAVLGGISAVGAVVGILGTLVYPRLRDRIGIERTGLYGFFMEVACLTLCIVSVWMPGSPFEAVYWCYDKKTFEMQNSTSVIKEEIKKDESYTSIALLMTGIVTARFGLWMADLTVNQLLQEEVAEEYRGAVNGVQNSINMVMNMLKFILVVSFPCHQTFGYLIIVSFAFICIGWFLYCIYSYKMRGHISPFGKHHFSTSETERRLTDNDNPEQQT